MRSKLAIFKIFALIIVISLLWSNYNFYFNTHFHVDENGRIILHSHPFSKNSSSKDLPNHHHNKNEFIALHLLHRIFSNTYFLIVTIFFFILTKKVAFIFIQTFPNKLLFKHAITKRGPPHLIYCS